MLINNETTITALFFLDNTFWVVLPNPQTLNVENLLCLD